MSTTADTTTGARKRRRTRTRRTGTAPAAEAVGAGFLTLGVIVRTLSGIIAALIALAVLLFDLGANAGNGLVHWIHGAANVFAGSFTGIFNWPAHADRTLTVDWAIAVVVYLLVGFALGELLDAIAEGSFLGARRHRQPDPGMTA